MGALEEEFAALRLQRQAYAKILQGIRNLYNGILSTLGAFIIVYFGPIFVAYVSGSVQNIMQQTSPVIFLFDPLGTLAYFAAGLPMLVAIYALYVGMTTVATSMFNSITKGTDLIDDGMRLLGRIGVHDRGPFKAGNSILIVGVTIIIGSAIPFIIATIPGNSQGSLGFFFFSQVAINIAFVLFAIGLILLGIALWRCGKTCGQGDVKEGGAATVVGMTLFLLSWGGILSFQFHLFTVPLQLNSATLLSLMPALPAYCVLGFFTALTGMAKAYIGIRRLI